MFGIRADLSGIKRLFERLDSFQKNEAPKIAASVIISDIREKTLAGRSSQNESFKPYTNAYARRRKKEGYQIDHVDLKKTWGLQDSIHFDPSDSVITVDSEHEKIAEGLSRKYEFLGDPAQDTASRVETNIASAIPRLKI